jgi:hypothetical protein
MWMARWKFMNRWLINPDAPATDGQKRIIKIMLRSKDLTEYWLHRGINKWINELTMGEADRVIKKLSKIKKNQNGGSKRKQNI